MSVDSATSRYQFPHLLGDCRTCFDGGRMTSDGGLVWLAEAESYLCEARPPQQRRALSGRPRSSGAEVRQLGGQIAALEVPAEQQL